ncbi:MAG: glycosyltransferase family 2 protein [Acidobacteriota bacterium]|jgi:GT2 family glycosyltransferase|nr:glycosyltransferase family 2 protein [Acidobacteriota bacterium]
MTPPLVSIVSICWNRKADIRESLFRIREIDYPNLEIIVVDNASTDGTFEMIGADFPEVRLLRMPENQGIAAYNAGFKAARGEYAVILDDDSFPHRDSLKRMVSKFENDASLGVVAFDVRNFYNYDDVKNETIDENEAGMETAAAAKYYLLAFNGAGAGVRLDVLRQAGFYPEEFFLYWNEQDTAFRILNMGYGIRFFSDVVAYHKFSPVNRNSRRAPFFYTRNAFWLIWKNYPSGMALDLTLRFMHACFYSSMEQKTLVYLQAMLAAFAHMGKLRGKRKPVSPDIARGLRIPFNLAFTYYR